MACDEFVILLLLNDIDLSSGFHTELFDDV